MERIPKGIYTPEFRAEAVKLVETTDLSVANAAKQLSLPKSSLDNGMRAATAGKLAWVKGSGCRVNWSGNWRGQARNWLKSRWSETC